MKRSQIGYLEGWKLVVIIGSSLLVATAAIALSQEDGVAGIRMAIRTTARTSVALFLLVFAASSLAALLPTRFTRWQLRNRRYLGLSFAVSHLLHASVIALLFEADNQLFWTLTNAGSIVSGGLAYLFIFLMAATSFDRAVSWIGPRRWRILHKVGVWYIWISFAVAFGKRIPGNSLYWLPVAALVLALGLRLAAWHSTRRSLLRPAA